MNKNEIMLLLDVALDVQMISEAKFGQPYVHVSVSNYCGDVNIDVIDSGFDMDKQLDGQYHFNLNKPYSERMYAQCVSHLRELKNRMEGASRA